jgi:hypothetical protein
MPLAGTFDVLDFEEVLGILSRRSLTGRLHLRTASMHGVIWLAEGQAASAEIGSGSGGGETRMRWQAHIEDICFDALRSPKGSFEFHLEDHGSVPAGPRVRLESILDAGRRRIEQWEDVESVIRSFEAVPRIADALDAESVTVTQEKWRVLACIDGRRNVAALARRLDMEVLDFCQLLKPLVESGAIVLDQPEGWLKSLPKVRLEPELPSIPTPVVPTVLPEGEEGVSVIDSEPLQIIPKPVGVAGSELVDPSQPAQGRRRRLRGRTGKLPAQSANT